MPPSTCTPSILACSSMASIRSVLAFILATSRTMSGFALAVEPPNPLVSAADLGREFLALAFDRLTLASRTEGKSAIENIDNAAMLLSHDCPCPVSHLRQTTAAPSCSQRPALRSVLRRTCPTQAGNYGAYVRSSNQVSRPIAEHHRLCSSRAAQIGLRKRSLSERTPAGHLAQLLLVPCYHRSRLSALRGRTVGCHRVHNMPVTRQPCTPAPWIADLAAFRVLRDDYLCAVSIRASRVHHFCYGLLFIQTHPPVRLRMDDILTTMSWARCPRFWEADTLASAWRNVRRHRPPQNPATSVTRSEIPQSG